MCVYLQFIAGYSKQIFSTNTNYWESPDQKQSLPSVLGPDVYNSKSKYAASSRFAHPFCMSTQSLQLAAVIRFLGNIWLREIELSTLQDLNRPSIRAAIEALGATVPNQIDAKNVEELAVDYCQLLIGPKQHIPPIQSVWQEQRFHGDAIPSMHRYFELLPSYHPRQGAMVDHIGVQLDFLGSLCEIDGNKPISEAVDRFFADHLKWSLPIFQKIERQATTEFYQGMAKVTFAVLKTFERSHDSNVA